VISPEVISFVVLTSISVAYSISVRRLERLRRALSAGQVPTLLSVWAFAASLILPPLLIAALVSISYVGEWPSRKIVGGGRPLRYIYSCASTIGASLVAAFVAESVDSVGGAVLALLSFSAVDISSTIVALLLAGQTHVIRMFASPKAHAVEFSTLFLGAALSQLLAWHAALGVLVVPLLLLVHRWALRETVKVEQAYDEETGLWSETAWRIQAQQRLYDAHGHVALIIIDPDGSGSDRQILDAIGSGLNSADLVGRYGSRQIVVLIPVGRREAGLFLSTGFRADLSRAGVNAPLGCATTADAELEGLLIEAMSDLMARRAAAGVDHAW
jgi:hypothetical protein